MALRDERRNGLDGIVLEGDEVSLSVFPAAGGKIMDLIHRPSGRNLCQQISSLPRTFIRIKSCGWTSAISAVTVRVNSRTYGRVAAGSAMIRRDRRSGVTAIETILRQK